MSRLAVPDCPALLRLTPPRWHYSRESSSPPGTLPRRRILIGDALDHVRRLPSRSVDCCVTSPPYYLLRDYGVDGQIGLEQNVEPWTERLTEVISEIGRVLKPSGSLWLNLGDSYSRSLRYGAPPKSLLMAPERLVFKLIDQGWVLRNKVIWAKPNPMPHSVRDRLNTSHEFLYFLVQQPHYYFALDAIRRSSRSRREPAKASTGKYAGSDRSWAGPLAGKNDGLVRAQREGRSSHPLGANPGDVWTIATGGYRGAHFATFPEQLLVRPILATCPERICQTCGTPWQRDVSEEVVGHRHPAGRDQWVNRYPSRWQMLRRLGQLRPACSCQVAWARGVVLDPFFGAGTVGVVAEALGRDWLGIELNRSYARLAQERIAAARASGR